jgi:predicted MFS family arabinose efflux permease
MASDASEATVRSREAVSSGRAELGAPVLSRKLLLAMATIAGLVVANIYYNQPLLADMARTFRVPAETIGWVAMLTQIGYALGMLFLLPLGDAVERRRLLSILCVVAGIALAGIALSPSFTLLAVASFFMGLMSVVPELMGPFAAYLSRPEERGRAVGTVVSGVLIGIMLARTVSGYVGQHFGWRAMFGIATVVMFICAVALRAWLPRSQPTERVSYGRLMRSLGRLLREQAVLRESCLIGATVFGAFSTLWATLVFRLEAPPYHYGSQVAGLFGLAGIGGALTAILAGRWADRRDPRQFLRGLILFGLVAFFLLWQFGHQLWGLALGTLLLDLAAEGGQACNQIRNFRLVSDAHSRMNSIYMTCFFLGASIGTTLGAHAWQRWGWPGVCAVGFVLVAIAVIKILLPMRRARFQPAAG